MQLHRRDCCWAHRAQKCAWRKWNGEEVHHLWVAYSGIRVAILGMCAFQVFWCIVWKCLNKQGEWQEGCVTQSSQPYAWPCVTTQPLLQTWPEVMGGKNHNISCTGEGAVGRQTWPVTNTEHRILHSSYFISSICAQGDVVQPKHTLSSSIHSCVQNRLECPTSFGLQPIEPAKTHAKIIPSHS